VNSGGSFGSLRLTGNDTYSGATSVGGGNFGVTALPNSALTLNSGADLNVEPDVTVAALTLNGGKVEWFGSATGVLTTGSFQSSGGFVAFPVNGLVPGTDYSQIRVNGPVNLGAGVTVPIFTFSSSFKPKPGDMFRLIDNQGAGPISGFFQGLPEGAVTNG